MVRVESSQGLALVGGVFLSTEIRPGIGKVFPQPLHFQVLLHFLRLHPKEFLLEACILSNRYLKIIYKKSEYLLDLGIVKSTGLKSQSFCAFTPL
jgi:hypothetical protein